jgi:hypothetical protein
MSPGTSARNLLIAGAAGLGALALRYMAKASLNGQLPEIRQLVDGDKLRYLAKEVMMIGTSGEIPGRSRGTPDVVGGDHDRCRARPAPVAGSHGP